MSVRRATDAAWIASGERRVTVPAPCDWAPPPTFQPPADATAALRTALHAPRGSASLRELAASARSAAIAIPDLSRACPNDLILPALLDQLNAGGVPDARIIVLIGCGLHRTTTVQEKRRLAGTQAWQRVRVADAQGSESPLADLGNTPDGCPVVMNAELAAADLAITVGVLEPHLYAGYSGGVKGIAIGCGGEPTILWTHRPAFISRAGVELCRLEGNPFQHTLREVARRTRLAFGVMAVLDSDGTPVDVAAGDPTAVQEHLAARFGPLWLCETPTLYDVVVAGTKAPKHENLYQASRAATYVGLASRPALADGGLLLLCTDLPNGAGDGPGEINFARVLASANPDTVIRRGLEGPLGPGGQRAFVVANVLRRFRVGVCGSADPGLLRTLGMASYRSLAEGLADARTRPGHAPRILAIADALTTVVRAAG